MDAWIDAVISSLGTLDLRTVEELEGSGGWHSGGRVW